MESEDLIRRVPPHNLEAEMACLGAMMSAPQAVDIVLETINEDDFFDEKNRIIFSAICTLRDASDPIDPVTVSDRLESSRLLTKAGGAAYLAKLTESVPAFSSVSYYAKVIMEKAILRGLLNSAMEIADNVYQYQSDVGKVANDAEQDVFNITSRQYRRGYVHVKDVINSTLRGIERIETSGEIYTGVPTGYPDFDQLTSGLQRGDLIVLAARPSMGKTALALNIAANVASKVKDGGILFFSLEMSTQELVLRLLSSESRIGLQKIRKAHISKEEWHYLIDAADNISKWKFIIDDTPGISVQEIRSKARRIVSREKVSIIIVDHLQLVAGTDSNKMVPNRVQEISYISRNLKAIAKELDLPVVVLSQLSRAVETRVDKHPLLSDLRESGAIEQDADIVTFLYRDDYYKRDKSESRGVTEFIVAKQRNGPTDTVFLTFLSDCVKFETADRHHEMQAPYNSDEPSY